MDFFSKKNISILSITASLLLILLISSKTILPEVIPNFSKVFLEDGRILLTFIQQIIYIGGKPLFLIVLLVTISIIFYLINKIVLLPILGEKYDKLQLLVGCSLSAIFFLFLGLQIFNETILSVDGFIYYILPFMFSLIGLNTVIRLLDNDKYKVLKLFVIFITSTTCAQGFIFLFITSFFYILHYHIKEKKINHNIYSIFTLQLLGFFILYMSPASKMNLIQHNTIFNYPIFKLIGENFIILSSKIISNNSLCIILGIFIIFIALIATREKKMNKLLLSGFIIGGITLLVSLLNIQHLYLSCILFAIIIIYFIFTIVELFKYDKYRIISSVLAGASITQGIIFFFSDISYSSLFYISLILIACISSIITMIFNSSNKKDINDMFVILTLILLFAGTSNVLQILININTQIFPIIAS